MEWRRIGNAVMDLSLPSVATGPVNRVWYSSSGEALFAHTRSGQIWETRDFENWTLTVLRIAPVKITIANAGSKPEWNARVEQASGRGSRYYAIGRFVYRSDDGGGTWTNVTGHRNQSILGEGLTDLAVSPKEPDEITVAGEFGVWRSLDGGTTWAGLNQGLPNLPARKMLSLPNGLAPARLALPLPDGSEFQVEWAPGERAAWRPAEGGISGGQTQLKQRIAEQVGVSIQTLSSQGEYVYAGSADGRIFASADKGQSWQQPFNFPNAGAVNAIWVNAGDPRIAVAALNLGKTDSVTSRVVRTSSGGRNWDDLSGNLPVSHVNSVVADAASGSVYAATDMGVFHTVTDLANLVAPSGWQRISSGLTPAIALDVKLDEGGNQLFVLLEGHGVFASMAPHRLRELSIVNAADFSNRAAAPGTLLSILGRRLERVRSGNLDVPVLGSTERETQIQVPFEATGTALPLSFDGLSSRSYPLTAVSPAIFIDRDGAPLLLDADGGVMLDAMNPARSGARVQILATGLGAVTPSWRSGVPAPADNSPRVIAPIRVFVDRQAVEVTRAILAPKHIGFYLIEIQLPQLINAGPAELYVEAGDRQSNRVRLYLTP
ncbi:MAG TPA: hypothetical protein VM120_12370 [Bryobacteraceae bacterium]|nr:hypothetical protein [Bryobacteraceae bacterium]